MLRDTITLSKDFTTASGDILVAGSKFFVTEWYNLGGGCFIDNPNNKYGSNTEHHVIGISNDYIAPKTEEELLILKRKHDDLTEKLRKYYQE